MKMETLEQLVAERRGYKYLNKDGSSPYKGFVFDLKNRKQMTTNLNTDTHTDCGEGWNLATLEWIVNDTHIIDKIIVEFSIPKEARIVVPRCSNGKFRTDIMKIKKIYKAETLFPEIKYLQKRLKTYNLINPITAEIMPPKSKIKKIMAQNGKQVSTQVVNQVVNQIRNQFRNQFRNQVVNQIRNQVWIKVVNQVRDQIWDQIWFEVRPQICDQILDQMENQVWISGYYAVKLFMGLLYEHPAFDLIRLGVIVININGKYKVFGKNGKFLGEFDK